MERIQRTVEPSEASPEDVDDIHASAPERRPLRREIVALGEGATAAAQSVLEAPSYEVVRRDDEEERRKIFNTNAKKLKNRFGEEFVKGRRQEDGQYQGLGARELLSKYLAIPGSVDEIKRLIPNKHNALKTLQDNPDYIAAQLAIAYDKEERLEEDEPPRDPYELAKNAGYELTGPFKEAGEFARYEADFRKGERICTYNNPAGRLRAYHMLWLRSVDADQTVPADDLNEDNLSESWKKYLRSIGRYEAASDAYNLDKLAPSRQDPYGTSSMSVQVSRRGTHVSIKNRYNHTVNSPDSTFDNNLDNVAYGLKRAVYHRVGREDLMKTPGHSLANNYIADNEGGIHYWYDVRDNIYFGYYEYIENGVVANIDRGQYDMIAPDVYVSKRGDGEVKLIAGEQKQAKFETLDDTTRRVSILDESGTLEQFYDYSYDEGQGVANLALTVAKGAKIGSVSGSRSPSLTKLIVAEGANVQSIYDNPALSELTIAGGAEIGYIAGNQALAELTVPKDAVIDHISYNPALSSLTIAGGAEINTIRNNQALAELTVPKDAVIDHILYNTSLEKITIARGATVRAIGPNHPDIKIRRLKWWQR